MAGVLQLADFIRQHQTVTVLSGAGCSTESGIPDYRDSKGQWKHRQPIQFLDFINDPQARSRYWMRSMLGWQHVHAAHPNAAHFAITVLERLGYIQQVITQNVDGLHTRAGTRSVLELHGNLGWVACMQCTARSPRTWMQECLQRQNPGLQVKPGKYLPDGDASLKDLDDLELHVPDCRQCGGILKPDVVFFGESVPRNRVCAATRMVENASALLVIGSSLMVYSGFRYCRQAHRDGTPVAILNLGRTRADDLATLKLDLPCAETMATTAAVLNV